MTDRINIVVGEKKHRLFKAMAARHGISITQMFLKAIIAWNQMNSTANKENNNGSSKTCCRAKQS